MKNPKQFRRVTGDDLDDHDVDHETVSYVDDSTNLITCNSVKELESYIRKSTTW